MSAPIAAVGVKPQRFARKEEIGRGGLGVVFRAEDTHDGRNVALRVFPAELLKPEGASAQLVADRIDRGAGRQRVPAHQGSQRPLKR